MVCKPIIKTFKDTNDWKEECLNMVFMLKFKQHLLEERPKNYYENKYDQKYHSC